MRANWLLRRGFRRLLSSSRDVHSMLLQYGAYGDPLKVVQLVTQELPSLGSKEVLVKMLAAPVNPSDINQLQGVYPVRPPLPAAGGNEGVGRVVAKGDLVKNLAVGDWVIPSGWGLGTWRTTLLCADDLLVPVASDIPLQMAASLCVNPPTAYRMLKDFVPLKRGDVVIQNAANSAVGQLIIQLCKVFGYLSVNIVRDRPDIDKLKEQLIKLGADCVLADSELTGDAGKQLWKSLPRPKLALNSVSGKSTLYLSGALTNDGKLVTFGGMSKMPLQIGTGSFIFRNISLHGFWITKWMNARENDVKKREMFDDLLRLIRDKQLQPPLCEMVPLNDYKTALEKSLQGKVGKKQMFIFDE